MCTRFLPRALARVIAGMALATAGSALAQSSYPTRPITLIIPYAAGGSADSLARALAQQLDKRLGQPVIVESRAGGGATIGTGQVARAKPDGYTLLVGTSAGHVVTPLMQSIPYDGVADFAFIGMVADQPSMLVVNSDLGVKDLKALVALARDQPGKLNYASAGTGGATHLGAESFLKKADIRITHVPYAGAAPALKDLLGGQVQMGMLNLSAVQAFIEQGRLTALAYGGKQRATAFGQVPTMTEAGYAGAEVSTWYSLAAPKGTPKNVIDKLSSALSETVADPAYQKFLATQGAEPLKLTPAQTTTFVQRDKETMGKLLGDLQLLDKSGR